MYIRTYGHTCLIILILLITGEASGLIYPNSKTKVAVKTTNNPLDSSQQEALLSEIKILSNLDLHLNLVNMMGSCTSDIHLSGELWLLLEFCEHGTIFLDSNFTFKNIENFDVN